MLKGKYEQIKRFVFSEEFEFIDIDESKKQDTIFKISQNTLNLKLASDRTSTKKHSSWENDVKFD